MKIKRGVLVKDAWRGKKTQVVTVAQGQGAVESKRRQGLFGSGWRVADRGVQMAPDGSKLA